MNIIGISGLNNSDGFKRQRFPNLEHRLYRITQGFDAAATLVTDEGVRCAASQERFCRRKATGAFPTDAIQFCLESSGLKISDIDFVAHSFDYEPYREFYRETELSAKQFENVYSKAAQLEQLHAAFPDIDWETRFVQVPHHVAHAASTFFVSGFERSLILVSDAMGEQHSASVAIGSGNDIEVIQQVPALHSLGVLYSVFTLYLGFDFSMDEYKVMGLAPYGRPHVYFSQIMDLINLKDDGTYTIPVLFANKTEFEKETYRGTLSALEEQFGPARQPNGEITQRHHDIASSLQAALQTCLLHTLRIFKSSTGEKSLCTAGGVALNCSANGVIKRSRMFEKFFIQPAAGDDGTSLGAALYQQRRHATEIRNSKMAMPYWGPEFGDDEIQKAIAAASCEFEAFPSSELLAEEVARRISNGEIIAWFQGRMEFGPRALGNRSILADPRCPNMRDRVNSLVKKRESFRPFAPAVLSDQASTYFEVDPGDHSLYEYMLCVTPVRAAYRALLPAITHIDGSARAQTVTKEGNLRFWEVIKAFGDITGVPILLNTSFNVKGQPIVCSPGEAVSTFLTAKLDALAIGNYLVFPRASDPSA